MREWNKSHLILIYIIRVIYIYEQHIPWLQRWLHHSIWIVHWYNRRDDHRCTALSSLKETRSSKQEEPYQMGTSASFSTLLLYPFGRNGRRSSNRSACFERYGFLCRIHTRGWITCQTIFGNFFASDASKGRFSAEKSSVNPLDRLFSEHLQLSNMDIILCMRS